MKNVYIILVIFSFFLAPITNAQEIQIITHGMTKYEPVGTIEIVIEFEVVNISQFEQTIFEVRTIDNMPTGWSSSLCFGELCFAPFIDSVATTPDFQTPPVAPGDTLKTSIHIFTDQVSVATAHVQIEVGTFRNPGNRFVLNFTGTTDPTVSVADNQLLNAYELYQNYPNPFNPSTNISFRITTEEFVNLKVFNVLGVEIATLVNEVLPAGSYNIKFNAEQINSGTYFYTLNTDNFKSTKKMILTK